MNDLTRLSVACTAQYALNKLKKAEIAVWHCKKEGVRFLFSVKDKDVKKVFAIFAKPCYNIKEVGLSRARWLLKLLSLRAGLAVGAAVFAAMAVFANSLVLKIEVEGSGSYLEHEVLTIIYDEGAREFSRLSSFDKSVATGRILALPDVTFCNIEKRGSILIIDVRTDGEHSSAVSYEPLVSDVSGKVVNIVAICGTAVAAVGGEVVAGDVLIAPYNLSGGERAECLAAGYAEIEVTGRSEYAADCDSEENLKNAYSSLLLNGDEIVSRTHTVREEGEGVVYVIDFTYLHKLSINLS